MLTAARLRLIVVTGLVVAGAFTVDALGAGSGAADGWNATLDYVAVEPPSFPRVSKLRLRVTHRGAIVYNRAVPLPRACRQGCQLGFVSFGSKAGAFQLVDLGSSKGPTALIWLATGGAHCCSIVRAVSIPDGTLAAKNFGDPGARLRLLGGSRLFVSADDRFAYLFTSFASSALPLQIWRLRDGGFSDLTRQFPAQIAADAARWWKLTQRADRSRGEARGVFAAWAADSCALGRKAAVRRELAARVVRGVFSPPRGEHAGFTGARYGAALLRTLKAWRYCR